MIHNFVNMFDLFDGDPITYENHSISTNDLYDQYSLDGGCNFFRNTHWLTIL